MSILSEWILSWFKKPEKRSSYQRSTMNEKNEILDALSVSHAKLAYCQSIAEENDQIEEAKKLADLKKELKVTIDKLTAEAFENWFGEIRIIKDDLNKAHDELGEIIESIEHQHAVLDNVVKAIGKVEEIITKAKSMIPLIGLT